MFHRLWHRHGEGSNQLVFGHRLVRRRNYYGDFLVLARGQVGEDHGRVQEHDSKEVQVHSRR